MFHFDLKLFRGSRANPRQPQEYWARFWSAFFRLGLSTRAMTFSTTHGGYPFFSKMLRISCSSSWSLSDEQINIGVVLLFSIEKFASHGNVFAILRQRYPVSVLKCFRKFLKCRFKRMPVRFEIQFLRQCLEESVAPRWVMTRLRKAKVKYSRKMEVAFLQDEINFK